LLLLFLLATYFPESSKFFAILIMSPIHIFEFINIAILHFIKASIPSHVRERISSIQISVLVRIVSISPSIYIRKSGHFLCHSAKHTRKAIFLNSRIACIQGKLLKMCDFVACEEIIQNMKSTINCYIFIIKAYLVNWWSLGYLEVIWDVSATRFINVSNRFFCFYGYLLSKVNIWLTEVSIFILNAILLMLIITE